MAVSKKYAGLPDLDVAPEIYETPELTDDASTLPTGTLRTESPTPSHDEDEGRHDPDAGLDRQKLDRDEARRRFEPALVNAKNVDFSDAVGVQKKSYITGHRRRRRRDRDYGDIFVGDKSESESEEETPAAKLARLKREAEEIRLELETHNGEEKIAERQDGLKDGVTELTKILESLDASSRPRTERSKETAFREKLRFEKALPGTGTETEPPQTAGQSVQTVDPSEATMETIASFSDRLSALETTLGLSSVPVDSPQTTSILPSLTKLSSQLSILTTSLLPPRNQFSTTMASSPPSQLPHLDLLANRLRNLTTESDKLMQSRKTATQALNELHEARLRHQAGLRPSSRHKQQSSQDETDAQNNIDPAVFVDSSYSAKIQALYQTLPTIQSLSPLLPVVVDRLRSLSVIHAGAGQARESMDDLERRLGEQDHAIRRWRDAVERCEHNVQELVGIMEGNVRVVGDMVKEVEDRVQGLEERMIVR